MNVDEEVPELTEDLISKVPAANIPITGYITPIAFVKSTAGTGTNDQDKKDDSEKDNDDVEMSNANPSSNNNDNGEGEGEGEGEQLRRPPAKIGPKFRYFRKCAVPMGEFPGDEVYHNKRNKRRRFHDFDQVAQLDDDTMGDPIEIMKKKVKYTPNKSPLQILQEITIPANQKLDFMFEEPVGPAHSKIFTVTTTFPLNGKSYTGQGSSKKHAKNNLAVVILTDIGIHVPTMDEVVSVRPPQLQQDFYNPNHNYDAGYDAEVLPPQAIDFSSDDIIMIRDEDLRSHYMQYNLPFQNQLSSSPKEPEPILTPPSEWEAFCLNRLKNIKNIVDSPIMALNTIVAPDLPEIVLDSEQTTGPFTAKLIYKGKLYEGSAQNKKKARSDAARRALMELLGPKLYQNLCDLEKSMEINESNNSSQTGPGRQLRDNSLGNSEPIDPLADEYNIIFSTTIEKMIKDKYKKIMEDDQEHAPLKVLAGVVMTRGATLLECPTVIAVTTGTKCLDGDCMSESGLALNDCHAEILANRCVRDYIYSQLDDAVQPDRTQEESKLMGSSEDGEKLLESDQKDAMHSIFNIVKNEGGHIWQFKLKPDIRFHLFINTSPCGDSRIFSPKGVEMDDIDDELQDSHPNRINRGVLRAKIESGEGTIPVMNLLKSGIQTWDSIQSGNALYTMSCSDKVCRWNALGFQGALLSILTGPIYYSSIILGSLHHPIHLKRALISRIEPLRDELIGSFKVNEPKILMTQNDDKRVVKKSPNHAIIWKLGWSTHEVVIANKGRCQAFTSRITKRLSFMRFLNLYMNKTGFKEDYLRLTYCEAKMLAEAYQLNKKKFEKCMKDQNFGNWISKPIEQDNFTPQLKSV